MNELEIIRHPQIHGLHIFFDHGLHIFFDSMEYRTPHFHSEWELTCVMENDLFACIDAQQILMHPGDMILIEPKQLHEYRCADRPCTFQEPPELEEPPEPEPELSVLAEELAFVHLISLLPESLIAFSISSWLTQSRSPSTSSTA